MSRLLWSRLVLTALLLCSGQQALAHAFSNAFLNLEIAQTNVNGSLRVRLQDVAWLADIDSNRDQALSWSELQQGQELLGQGVQDQLHLATPAEPCKLTVGALSLQELNTGMFVEFPLTAACAEIPAALRIDYNLLMSVDAAHRGIVEVRNGAIVATDVFTPSAQSIEFSLDAAHSQLGLLAFLQEGVWHIWTGYDHLLFLLALLLPLFLRREGGVHWHLPPTASVIRSVLWTVTAFTLAHSLTLLLSSLLQLQLASAVVETLIAVSVALSGLNILWPIFSNNHSIIAFSFGLIHGLGFAGALRDLSLPASAFVQSLLSFNVGVEAGQLVLVALVFPLLLYLRRQRYYQSYLQPLLSMGIIAIGMAWAVARGVAI
ncbi:MAG: HupE/UreJ family protein [Pseudomonadota bacterium]